MVIHYILYYPCTQAINIEKWAACYHNPETFDPEPDPSKNKCTQGNRTDFDGWSLTFPSNSNFAPQHGMERWYDDGSPYWIPVKSDNDGSGKGSRFGDVVNYRDLIVDLKDPAVANALGGSDFVSVSGGVITCGSVGEVANDPTFGAMFDAENNKEETSSDKDHNQQRTKIWTAINLFEKDQLRQRMAWALSQILTIVPGNIDADTETEIYVSYYDIFVRHAFGNYLDILKEISYSPLQAEHLTYLASKSHAYIFQDEDKRVSSADENFAREISQVRAIHLFILYYDRTMYAFSISIHALLSFLTLSFYHGPFLCLMLFPSTRTALHDRPRHAQPRRNSQARRTRQHNSSL